MYVCIHVFFTFRYCGEQKVDFHTREDITNIQIYVKNPKKETVEITLNMTPHYLCGGKVVEEKNITSPGFPLDYERDYACLWQIQVSTITVRVLYLR